ncbi:uncharacterized protein LOC126815368 isoform X2 [Patella vulgata]|uniref:uncharacterized protein LOC126815368 isoform X2 n=1 Tax=Patella vulgata TaxID=6465 RepID=UPI0024A83751|nr:uncharacterized protein LOC126815368 isoform X2 [Patella vulgata]
MILHITDVFGLILLVCVTKKSSCCRKVPNVTGHSAVAHLDTATIKTKLNNGTGPWPFLSQFDQNVLESLDLFVNQPKELFLIALPCFLSLAFCPLTLFLHIPILNLFWPEELFQPIPNTNDGIACFLVPAGMVYAISFGFAFQQVMSKQQATDLYINQQVDDMHRLLTMVSKMTLSCSTTKLDIYQLVKNEMVKFILYIQDKDIPTHLPDLMDVIRLISDDPTGWSPVFNTSVRKAIVRIVTDAPYTVGSKAPSKQRINLLQWAFLETLGYFTFLGILLVKGESYRMELSMCIITVVSISMLCYIVADMDSPFHGFFRSDLAVVKGLAERLEDIYGQETQRLQTKCTE